ncbi:MAG: redoxin domain-containing protein [Desulfosarcina sp.]|nr:redoxin domain-containing protein [Desulfosarcina sp.]MBC2742419.1 redoxin domain-containing protein [Desulfosarcina sp.]MBC2765329.1 redoxin domain-containing protein [Desulfosarcina sp.]
MRYTNTTLRVAGLVMAFFWSTIALAGAQPVAGQKGPDFTLNDAKGSPYVLSALKNHQMAVLFFFDAASRPSQEGLAYLDSLRKRFSDNNLVVWAITMSPSGAVARYIKQAAPAFPVLLDPGAVSDQYGAKAILPTVCVIGPDRKVLDVFQGGGKTTEVLLVRLAERTLSRKETLMAKAISDTVLAKNPDNIEAKAVKGYAEMKSGNLKDAETIFQDVAAQPGKGEVLGQEGLSAVYAEKGEDEKAMAMADQVTRKAPKRGFAHVVKANVLYRQNKKDAAKTEFKKAVNKPESSPHQRAVALNKYGRFYASVGKHEKARELYDQAVAVDPYFVEATANKGMSYQREGQWDQALAAYRKASGIDTTDSFAALLARKAQEMIELQKDADKRKQIDALVKDLAERYRNQQANPTANEDEWTSRPLVFAFVDFQEKGGLADRDGMSTILTTQLADHLNASGRVKVVDRVVLARLLSELNLGSSDLADPDTALRLGRVMAARIMGTGTLFTMPGDTLVNLRLVDTETSAIAKTLTRQLGPESGWNKELHRLNREILAAIVTSYPLQGYVVQALGDQALINLGADQGMVQGTRLDVLEETKPIEYKGRKLQGLPKVVAQLEVISVETDLCHARIVKKERDLKADDKVRENASPI